jgi:hypothetical protein
VFACDGEQLVLLVKADAESLTHPLRPRNMLVGQDESPVSIFDERPRSPGFAVIAAVDEHRRPILLQVSGHVSGERGHRRFPLFLSEEQLRFRDIWILVRHIRSDREAGSA